MLVLIGQNLGVVSETKRSTAGKEWVEHTLGVSVERGGMFKSTDVVHVKLSKEHVQKGIPATLNADSGKKIQVSIWQKVYKSKSGNVGLETHLIDVLPTK